MRSFEGANIRAKQIVYGDQYVTTPGDQYPYGGTRIEDKPGGYPEVFPTDVVVGGEVISSRNVPTQEEVQPDSYPAADEHVAAAREAVLAAYDTSPLPAVETTASETTPTTESFDPAQLYIRAQAEADQLPQAQGSANTKDALRDGVAKAFSKR